MKRYEKTPIDTKLQVEKLKSRGLIVNYCNILSSGVRGVGAGRSGVGIDQSFLPGVLRN